MHNINHVRRISFPLRGTMDSFLVVFEGETDVPFVIKRTFVVKSTDEASRGFHAHRECSQLLVALNGVCDVKCDDGNAVKHFTLNVASDGLLIPPGIWAEQDYQSDTILMVLTDRRFDESDYLRDYEKFLAFRRQL